MVIKHQKHSNWGHEWGKWWSICPPTWSNSVYIASKKMLEEFFWTQEIEPRVILNLDNLRALSKIPIYYSQTNLRYLLASQATILALKLEKSLFLEIVKHQAKNLLKCIFSKSTESTQALFVSPPTVYSPFMLAKGPK